MTFAEKLDKLIGHRSRSEIAAMSGVPAQTITNYVTRGTEPSFSSAGKLARALNVSLDWLGNDAAVFPPPQLRDERSMLINTPTSELLRELARRLRMEQLESDAALKRVESVDWEKVAGMLAAKPDELPITAKAAMRKLSEFSHRYSAVTLHESLLLAADMMHDELPGPDRPTASELRRNLLSRLEKLSERPAYKRAFDFVFRHRSHFGFDAERTFGFELMDELFKAIGFVKKGDKTLKEEAVKMLEDVQNVGNRRKSGKQRSH